MSRQCSLSAPKKSLLLALCVLGLVGVFSASAHAQNVTFAGVQTTVVQSVVLGAELCPYSVAVDKAGDVFIADYCNDRVVEVAAGSGAQTLVGSGLSGPRGVAVDGAGNIFIADTLHNQVIKVPAGGGAQTLVGTGLSGPYGVAVDSAGDVFIADTSNNRVVKVPAGNGAQTLVGSGLIGPQGVAVDSAGDVFIADTFNSRVVKVPAGGGAQTTVGTLLSYPTGVAVDAAGNIFIADNLDSLVVEVPSAGGAQITLGSGLNQPGGVAVDGAGDVFIADTYTNRVLEQQSVAVNFGNVNVCPGVQTTPVPCNQTLTLNYNVVATTTFGTPKVVTQGAPNLDFKLSSGSTCAGTVAAGNTCTLNVAFAPLAPGGRMGAVQLVNNSGNLLATTMVHGIGQGPAIAFGPGAQTTVSSGLGSPDGVAVDAAGDLFVADTANNRVVKIPAGGGAQSTVGSGLSQPYGVALDGAGDIFIADTANNRVVEVPVGGGPQSTVGSGLSGPHGVVVDGAGNVYIADSSHNRVVKIPAGGGAQSTVGSGLSGPYGVAVDGAGGVFVADTSNNRVVEVPASGSPQTTLASGLNQPGGVAVDGAGHVFIADVFNNRVVEVPAGGGVPSTLSSGLSSPGGVAVDGAGNVFIADTINNRVLEMQRALPPTLNFAATAVGTSSASPQSVIIQNTGNQPLNAVTPGLLVAGPNFIQVPGSGTPADCTSSFALAPGATCDLSIGFVPQTVGPLTSTVTVTDNTLNTLPNTSQTVTLQGIGQGTQAITFTTNAPTTAPINSSFTVAATGGASGNPVTFTSSGACTNLGATYTITSNTGTCSVIANQAGNTFYSAASTVTQTVTATTASQTITFTQSAPAHAPYNSSFTVTATGGASGNPVTFTSSGVCTNLGATYTITASTGACKVIANQSGNGNYLPAPTVTETTTAGKAAQTVTFTGAPAAAPYLSNFTVTTSSNSGITPTITAAGGCSISGNNVTMTSGTGPCTMTAKWAGNANYLAATVVKTTTAQKLASALTWNTPAAVPFGTLLSGTQLNATAPVAGSFAYTPAAGTIPKAGNDTLKVTFTPTASNDYTTVTASVVLHVNPATSTVTWAAPAPIAYGTPLSATQLDATANVPGTFVYSPAAGTVLAAGTHTLSVTFTPTDHTDYAKTTAKVTLTVNPATTTTTVSSNLPNPSAVGQPVTVHFTVTQATNYAAPVGNVTVNASTLEHCAGPLASGSGSCAVTFNSPGMRTLTATYAGNSNNSSSISAPVTQTVN